MSEPTNRDPYLIKSVVHASALIAAFRAPGEVLSPKEIATRSGLSRGIVFRLLYTFERCGLVDKIGNDQYRLLVRSGSPRIHKIGYAAAGNSSLFVGEVTGSLRFAAEKMDGIELLMLDNRFSTAIALRNAEQFIRERVDLVIEYQVDEQAASAIAAKFSNADVPCIAINNPHPGATYFGANNYEAGLMGGRYLGRWAAQYWGGAVDEMLMIDLGRASTIPRSRINGTIAGIREILRDAVDRVPVVELDGDGRFDLCWEVTRAHLRNSKPGRTLISGINDTSVLGALRAFEEAGREAECAAMGQNGSPEARDELRRRQGPFIGSVAYFPENYGTALLRLALDILDRRFVPPAVFTKHQLLTPKNLDHVYPNDPLRPQDRK